jgi:ankyrin repeat protein
LASKGASLVEKNKQGDTPLLKAARQGNAKCFKLLIDLLMQTENDHGKLQQWISTPNNKGYTPLHEAAIWGNTEIVTDILERKLIDVNVGDLDGNTVLHLAGDRKLTAGINIKTDHVKLLLEHGADPNKKNNAGNTPMHLTDCSSEYLALLMSYGGSAVVQNNNGETPLETQLKVGNVFNFDALLSNITAHKEKLVTPISFHNMLDLKFGGRGILHLFVEEDLLEPLKFVLSAWEDLDLTTIKNDRQETLSLVALKSHAMHSFIYLTKDKKLHFDVNLIEEVVDGDGNTIAHKMAAQNFAEGLQFLLDSGVKPDLTNKLVDVYIDGGELIHVAAIGGAIDTIRVILNKDMTLVNTQSNPGKDSPLHLAAKFGRDAVRLEKLYT